MAETLAGFAKRVDQRFIVAGEADHDRAVAAAIFAGPAFPAFLSLEIGQGMSIGPLRQPALGPAVVIAAIAADIAHDIDRGGAADHLAARAFDAAAVESRLGFREIHPVMQPVREDLAPAERDVDQGIAIPAARFEQHHAHIGVFGQAMGEAAPGRAGADDDVVIAQRARHSAGPSLVLLAGDHPRATRGLQPCSGAEISSAWDVVLTLSSSRACRGTRVRLAARPTMGAFVYILRCADGSYYTGSTRASLDERTTQHEIGI